MAADRVDRALQQGVAGGRAVVVVLDLQAHDVDVGDGEHGGRPARAVDLVPEVRQPRSAGARAGQGVGLGQRKPVHQRVAIGLGLRTVAAPPAGDRAPPARDRPRLGRRASTAAARSAAAPRSVLGQGSFACRQVAVAPGGGTSRASALASRASRPHREAAAAWSRRSALSWRCRALRSRRSRPTSYAPRSRPRMRARSPASGPMLSCPPTIASSGDRVHLAIAR